MGNVGMDLGHSFRSVGIKMCENLVEMIPQELHTGQADAPY